MAKDITSNVDVSALVDGQPADASDVLTPIQDLVGEINNLLNGVQPFDQIRFDDSAAAVPISTGALSATRTYVTVDTQGAVSSDDLDTINGTAGDVLYLRAADDNRTVVIKHGTGNIVTGDAQDHELDNADKVAHLVNWGSTWYLVSIIEAGGGSSVDPLALDTESELTIATGAITATQTLHTVDTESNAASDDLETINSAVGDVLYLMAAHTDRTVVLKHGVGNILCGDAQDHALNDTNKVAHLVRIGGNWLLVAIIETASGSGTVIPGTVHARLSLSSSDPAPTADQTAATTLYLLPYGGEHIALYDGSTSWGYFALGSSGISISIPATTDTNYDAFVYDSGGLTLELVAWTNATNRATAIVLQDGVYVKDGETNKLYLGTIRTTDVSGQCEDSKAKRLVYNHYNRLPRVMQVIEGTDSWSYTSTTLRSLNNSTANRLQFVLGISQFVDARIAGAARTASGANFALGIGLDSTSAISTDTIGGRGGISGAGVAFFTSAFYRGSPGIGFHFLQALESGSTGITFVGDDGGVLYKCGIQGVIEA